MAGTFDARWRHKHAHCSYGCSELVSVDMDAELSFICSSAGIKPTAPDSDDKYISVVCVSRPGFPAL